MFAMNVDWHGDTTFNERHTGHVIKVMTESSFNTLAFLPSHLCIYIEGIFYVLEG
jgi:hypothetical protein